MPRLRIASLLGLALAPVGLLHAESPAVRTVPVFAQESVLRLDDQDGSLSGVGPSNVDDRGSTNRTTPAPEQPLEELTIPQLIERIEALESRHDILHDITH